MIRSEDRKVFPRKNWNIVFPILATRKCNERERGKTFGKERRLKRKKKIVKREATLEERRLFQCLPPLNPLMTKYEHCRFLSCEISMLVFHA